jgi:hypothetical protein
MRKLFLVVLVAFIGCFILAQTSFAATVVAYEWSPGQILSPGSTSTVGGPVLADDFVPIISGFVVQVDWWGSEPPFFPYWELTFYNDDGPASPSSVLGQYSAFDVGSPYGPGILMYSALWEPQDVFINAGTTYWFSVANLFGPDWMWAIPGADPPVGDSPDHAEVSWDPPGGPWIPAHEPNYAFRVWVEVEETSPVPIPGAIYLLGSGLLGLVGIRKKMKS